MLVMPAQPLAAHVVPETKLPETKIAAASCEATAISSPGREAYLPSIEAVADRAGRRAQDDDEQGRQDEQDQRDGHDRGQARGLFLGAHHALVAEFGRQHAQRRGERRAVFLGLDHGRDDAAHRFEVDARGEVLERLAALVEEAQLDRGQPEFVAQFGIGLAQFLGDAVEGGVDGQARLGADDEQVERVGQALADRVGCAS